jgi:hypothetical protein
VRGHCVTLPLFPRAIHPDVVLLINDITPF